MKLLSIIIVTYNSQDYIEKCLDNLFRHNDIGQDLEVIIVDNSSEEIFRTMLNILEKKYLNRVKFIKNDSNNGYGYGNNTGIKVAQGQYIAIMNPDITMTQPLFHDAIKQLKGNNNIGMLGYKQYGGHNLSFYLRQEFYIPIFTSILTKICNRIDLFNQNYMYLSGAFFFTKKETFEQIGNFDEKIFLYFEEPDITNRFLNFGFSIKYDKSKSYIHEIDGRKEMSHSGFKFLLDSTVYYLDKFSINKRKYLAKLIVELKFKKTVYAILGNHDGKSAAEEQLRQVVNLKKTIL